MPIKNKKIIMPIDTDDLSDKTYEAIMIEAEKFNHDLTLQFGLLSYECENEKEFISKSQMLISEMLTYNKYETDDMFFGNPPSKKEFHVALKKIETNIKNL
jgi:hypothetical protein